MWFDKLFLHLLVSSIWNLKKENQLKLKSWYHGVVDFISIKHYVCSQNYDAFFLSKIGEILPIHPTQSQWSGPGPQKPNLEQQ